MCVCVMHCGVILSDSRCFPNCVLQNPGIPCCVSSKSVRKFRRQQKFPLRIHNNVASYWLICALICVKTRVCTGQSDTSRYDV